MRPTSAQVTGLELCLVPAIARSDAPTRVDAELVTGFSGRVRGTKDDSRRLAIPVGRSGQGVVLELALED